ncbi:MAG: hypothetical protein JWM33_38 [Caulobacteraceae bacterium]|nr:hypothetical protein [Caulobacteraceae bacterium]
MSRLILRLLTLLLGAACLAAAAPAPPSGGPAWWRISDRGGSVLWIMGMPDGMPMDTAWNDASLRRRLSAARLLVSPLLGKSISHPDPGWTYGAQGMREMSYAIATTPFAAVQQNVPVSMIWGRTLGAPERTFKDPPAKRLPPELLKRLQAVQPAAIGNNRTVLANAKTWELAVWLDLWNWPRGKLLGNPVTGRAQDLAENARLPIDPVYVPALWKPVLLDSHPMSVGSQIWADYDWIYDILPNFRIVPPEAVQQKCLAQVIAQAESKRMPALRLAALEAWARGDVDHALKRSNSVQLCLMGDQPSTDAASFERSHALT